jgi:hypothetical protein
VRNGMRHPTVAVRRRHRDKMNEFNIFATVWARTFKLGYNVELDHTHLLKGDDVTSYFLSAAVRRFVKFNRVNWHTKMRTSWPASVKCDYTGKFIIQMRTLRWKQQ